MNVWIDSSDCLPIADLPAINVTIIYEDFASGTRAKHFATRLAGQLGRGCELSATIWRTELLECPPLATQAAFAAADCDYLIVSLRGDRALPVATRQWIEGQLDGAAAREAALIALINCGGEMWRAGEDARHLLGTLCAEKDVPFFSHPAITPADVTPPGRSSMGETSEFSFLPQ